MLLRLLFDGLLEAGEGAAPELVQFGPELAEAIGIDVIDAASSVRPIRDQPGGLEHLQVLRHGGTADRKVPGQFADRARTAGEPTEDGPSRAVAECSPRIGFVSRH